MGAIIATAAVPAHSRLSDADTAPLPTTPDETPMTDAEMRAWWLGYNAGRADEGAATRWFDGEAVPEAVREAVATSLGNIGRELRALAVLIEVQSILDNEDMSGAEKLTALGLGEAS